MTLIETHPSNSAWWGRPVALVTDPQWFGQDEDLRRESLAPYAWAEFKAPLASAPPALELGRAGFVLVDAQINFRIGLALIASSTSLDDFECHSASLEPFAIRPEDVRPFEHERFRQIPGVTDAMINRRYANWANELVARHPTGCLRLAHGGRTQGWFLSEISGSSVHLILAMLSNTAIASGQHLYHRALLEYARLGARMGHASFSVGNTSVLNIYAQLGARFTPPTGCWLWVRPELNMPMTGIEP
jgi:hypothetical protein